MMTRYPIPDTRYPRYGFTLIELVIVIVVIGLLTAIGAPLMIHLVDSFQYSIYRRNLSEGIEVALHRILREIIRLRDETSVLLAGNNTYRFVDIDGNTIQYQLNGSTLERTCNSNTDVLLVNVSSFALTYLTDDSTVISAPLVNPQATDIKFIDVDITVTSDDNILSYKTRLRLRNVVHACDLFS